jgi:hypothetical protein
MNNELETTRKEAVVADICLERPRKAMETTVRIDGLWAEI